MVECGEPKHVQSYDGPTLWLALVALLPVCAGGGEGDRPHREQLRFDPQQQSWVELPQPTPGTPQGDLARARSQLADGQFKSARKVMKLWMATHTLRRTPLK